MKNGAESSLVSEVKEKQDQDPIRLNLKGSALKQRVLTFEQGEDWVFKYQGSLCIPKVDGLQERIFEEAYSSRYSFYLGYCNLFHNLRDI